MIGNFKVPTIFSAVDKLTPTLGKIDSGVGRLHKSLNKASTYSAAIGGGVIAASLPLIYDSLTKYDDALASFRTIVSDLNDADFSKYTKSIEKVAKDTRNSTVNIAQSFETIAGLNEKFAETPESIQAVAAANAILSKASRMQMEESAGALVGIMNQYSLAADQADRTINVLAAGQAVGAASIKQTAESFTVFGSVAKGANITLEESVGLIQTLGKFSLYGSEAGTKLRGSILKLQQAGMGYASGQFNINDALEETSKKLNRLGTEQAKDAFLTKMFGTENITTGRILLNNIGVYQEFTKGVTGTSEAHKAAAINSNTFLSKLQEVKDGIINYITTNDESNKSLDYAKNILEKVYTNLDTIIPLVINITAALIGFKIAMIAINGVLAVGKVVMAGYAIVLKAYNIVALSAAVGGYTLAGAIWAALWPILAVIAIIALVVAAFYYWDDICKWFGKQWDKFTSWIGETWDKLVAWFKYFSFVNFFKSIGNSIIEFLLFPLNSVLTLLSKLPGKVGAMAQQALDLTQSIKFDIEPTTSAQLSPASTAQVATSEKITTSNSNMQIDINDKNNNVGGIQTFGAPIPIMLNGTKFGV